MAHRQDSYYASATAAIGRRDYAEALELLQAARERASPDDVRVLNAFGVIYDKLGRTGSTSSAQAITPRPRRLIHRVVDRGQQNRLFRRDAQPGRGFGRRTRSAGRVRPGGGPRAADAERPTRTVGAASPIDEAGGHSPGLCALRRFVRGEPTLAGRALDIADASGRKRRGRTGAAGDWSASAGPLPGRLPARRAAKPGPPSAILPAAWRWPVPSRGRCRPASNLWIAVGPATASVSSSAPTPLRGR